MNNVSDWYQTLIKPSFAPPSWLFGLVWTVLYAIIVVSFGAVFYKVFVTKELAKIVALPFVFNLIFNFTFSPIQFGLKNNFLAAIDILLVVGSLVWALVSFWNAAPDLRWVVYVNFPYLLWGIFATVLQLTITWMNK